MASPENDSSPAVSVEVRDLRKSYGRQEVLRGVTLDLHPGEIFVLMGSSGSGKSVLLKHVIGLEHADSGSVLIAGRNAADPATHRAVATAMVFQAGALFNSLSVYDNLALYPREHRLHDEAEIRSKVEGAMQALGIADAADKVPATLSGGMRKRVAVARAIVMEPQLILYDEPTSELDPLTAATVSELISRIRRDTGATSFVVTHDRDLALGIADRIALLEGGQLIFCGTAEEFRSSDQEAVQQFLHPQIRVARTPSQA